MITICTKLNVNKKYIEYLKMIGHANFAEHGSDIVCAGVSSTILSNIMYAQAHELGDFVVEQSEGLLIVTIKQFDPTLEVLLQASLLGIKLIDEQYPNYIKFYENGGE